MDAEPFDKTIYLDKVNIDDYLTQDQKENIIQIINEYRNVKLLIIENNIVIKILKFNYSNYVYIYIVYDKYIIVKQIDLYFKKIYIEFMYLSHNGDKKYFYKMFVLDDDMNIINIRHNIELTKNLLKKYSLNENILDLFKNERLVSKLICENINKNITDDIVASNIILGYNLRDKLFSMLEMESIVLDVNGILQIIFGFIPKITKYDFVD